MTKITDIGAIFLLACENGFDLNEGRPACEHPSLAFSAPP